MGRSGANLPDEAGLTVTARLDTQQAARFLSYPGILLESWRGKHLFERAVPEIGLPDSGSRKAVSNRKQTAAGSLAGTRTRDGFF